MVKGLFELLKHQPKYGGQLETLISKSISVKKPVDELNELKRRIRSILISAGKPCRVSEITKDYRTFFGEEFPIWDVGCVNPRQVLEMMPDVCEISEECYSDPYISVKITEKNAHIFNLVRKNVAKPKEVIATVKDVFVPFTLQDCMRRILYLNKRIWFSEFLKKLECEFDLKDMNLDNIDPKILSQSLPHILYYDKGMVKSVDDISASEIEVPEYLHVDDEFLIPSYRLSKTECYIAKIICLLIEENKVISLMNIPELYFKKCRKKLNWFHFGFHDLWRFLSLLPGDFKLVVETERQFVTMTTNSGADDEVDIREFHPSNYRGLEVYKQVLKKVRYIVSLTSKGLNVKYLQSLYETMYFEKLVLRKGLHAFLLDLENFNLVRIEKHEENMILFPSEGPDKLHEEMIPKEITKFEKGGYPIDVLKPGEGLKYLNFCKVMKPALQQFCVAVFTCIENPEDFNLRILSFDENHKGELEEKYNDMLFNLEEMYTETSEEFDIPVELIRKGLVCAACVSGHWQRSKIVDVYDSFLKVRLLDEGKCANVTLENLKFLHKQFAGLPILNLKASLFNIKPVGFEWSVPALVKFVDLMSISSNVARALSVLIVERNDEDIYHVILTVVNNDSEIHIGDELVECGYGEFKCTDKRLQIAFC